MTPLEVLEQVEGLGYRLGLRPGGLLLTSDTEPTFEVLALIQAHRAELLALLVEEAERDLAEERAAILEHDGGMSPEGAERLAGVGS